MTQAPEYNNPEFDSFAEDYDGALDKGLSVSGEKKEYFAERRIEWLQKRLDQLNFTPQTILDFGCGTGGSTPYLLKLTGAKNLFGVEVSPKSIQVARKLFPQPNVQFKLSSDYTPKGEIDLAFCNGVFHHIPIVERSKALSYVHSSLRPGGLFALWENNPWNPGTRYIMSRIPFDRDAITLPPPETKRLLTEAGFKVVTVDFLFLFPKMLGFLRPLEKLVHQAPLGAQYMALAQKA